MPPYNQGHGYVEALIDRAIARLLRNGPVPVADLPQWAPKEVANHCGPHIVQAEKPSRWARDVKYALTLNGAEVADGYLVSYRPRRLRSAASREAFAIDDAAGKGFDLPEEVGDARQFVEGACRKVFVNAYERDVRARGVCIQHYGAVCCICGFDFGEAYGAVAEGYIHVHHLRPLSLVEGEYVVDPVKDLRPVCPNCHAVLHLGSACRSIEEVAAMVQHHRRGKRR